MFSISEGDLDFIKNYTSTIIEKLGNVREQLQYTNDNQIEYLNIFDSCEVAANISQQLINQYEMLKDQTEFLQKSLRHCEGQMKNLGEENSRLNETIYTLEENKNINNSVIEEFDDKIQLLSERNKEEQRIYILEELNRMEEIYQSKLKTLENYLAIRQQKITQLQLKLINLREELQLKTTQLQLAQLVLQDSWKCKDQLIGNKESQLQQTFSPCFNHSNSSFKQTPKSSMSQFRRKQGSLLQDLYESEINYNQPQYFSHYNNSCQTLPQIQQSQQKKNQQLMVLRLNSQYSLRSPYHKSNLKKSALKINRYISLISKDSGTQTQNVSNKSGIFNWLKERIITKRLKK